MLRSALPLSYGPHLHLNQPLWSDHRLGNSPINAAATLGNQGDLVGLAEQHELAGAGGHPLARAGSSFPGPGPTKGPLGHIQTQENGGT